VPAGRSATATTRSVAASTRRFGAQGGRSGLRALPAAGPADGVARLSSQPGSS
jgi:hypothetical protein